MLPLLLVLAIAGAGPVPPLNVRDLTAVSEVIVLGSVSFVMDAGPMSVPHANGEIAGRRKVAQVAVDEVLKGEADPVAVQVEFLQPELPSSGYGTVAAGEYLVIFLRRNGNRYEFASHYHPSLVSIRGARTDPSLPALGRVVDAVAAVLRSPNAPEPLKRSAIFDLWEVDTPSSIAALELLLDDPDVSVKLNAVTGLLRSNHVGALAVAEAYLLRADRPIPTYLLQNLRGGIATGITTEAAIPALVRLLAAAEVETRRAAAEALRRMRSPAVVTALAKALDDPDLRVKYNAVSGLAEITGRTTAHPSLPLFEANPEPYVRYWKDWVVRR